MADSYVCSKAKIKCSFGDKISTLTVLPIRTIWLTGQPQANISDHQPFVNIAPFGRCHTVTFPDTGSATAANHGVLTPMPCRPGTIFPWMNGKNDVLLQGQPALLKTSICNCVYGGLITINHDGQTDGNQKLVDTDIRNSQEQLENYIDPSLTTENILDGIQLALDAAGMVPVLGAAPDLLNAAISVCRGNWLDAGLSVVSAVPVIGDVVGGAKIAAKGAKIAKTAKVSEKAFSKVAKKFISKDLTDAKIKKICKTPEEAIALKNAVRKEREKVAYSFYKRHGMPPKDIPSHVNCIDLDRPVKVAKVPPKGQNKMELYRYMQRTDDGTVKAGRYLTDSPNATPSQLGVATPDENLFSFTIKGDTTRGQGYDCLISTAKPTKAPLDGNWSSKDLSNFIDTEGGATQYFIQDAVNRPILRTAKKL